MHIEPIKIIDANQVILICHKNERRKWIIGHEAFIGSHALWVTLYVAKSPNQRVLSL